MEVKETYKILVDWSKYQHEKMQHFNTVNIAIHTLIITAIGSIIIKEIINNKTWFLLAITTIIGIILGIIWFLGLCRCRLDVDIFYGLLRSLEKYFDQKQRIFTEGYNFYHCKEVVTEELKELKCRSQFWGLLKLYQAYICVAWLLYSGVLICALYKLLCIRIS